jgi:hypothetical protein
VFDSHFERSIPLDMTRLQGNFGDMEYRIAGDLNRFEFGSIETHLKPFEGANQSLMDRVIA